MAIPDTFTSVREEQRVRVLKQGGRVLKFTINGGKLYFRYYFPHPHLLTWNKLTNGLRVLYSVASPGIYIRYIDTEGSKITVSDDGGLKIMFDEMKDTDVIRIEVLTEDDSGNMPRQDNSMPPSVPAAPTMAMPMPMPPSGFPGMDTRPGSALSNHTAAVGQMHHQPGPVPQNIQQPFGNAGPMNVPQGYGRMTNASMSTLPPPNPQDPLD
ncbi:hypothetical protein IWW37_005903 [Coemansia sp. RSA 2050]|nr:hypothetical protein IWW37_005903 [Coemansia sp. RSA 2050]KAJ2728642.1 hypothetical protein IW152_005908 [Coemansia sp. BCRC 34962]